MPDLPRLSEPPKMTSSIALPRRCFADCSPMHQRIASTMLDLPQPFGPTTPVTGGSKVSTVRSQNDLKPTISSRLIRIHSLPGGPGAHAGASDVTYGHVSRPRC